MVIENINNIQPFTSEVKPEIEQQKEINVIKPRGNNSHLYATLLGLAAIGATGVAIYEHKETKITKEALKKAKEEAKKQIAESEEKIKKATEDIDKKIQEGIDKAKKEINKERKLPKNEKRSIKKYKPYVINDTTSQKPEIRVIQPKTKPANLYAIKPLLEILPIKNLKPKAPETQIFREELKGVNIKPNAIDIEEKVNVPFVSNFHVDSAEEQRIPKILEGNILDTELTEVFGTYTGKEKEIGIINVPRTMPKFMNRLKRLFFNRVRQTTQTHGIVRTYEHKLNGKLDMERFINSFIKKPNSDSEHAWIQSKYDRMAIELDNKEKIAKYFDNGARKGLRELELEEDSKRYTKLVSDVKNANWLQEQKLKKEKEFEEVFNNSH